ncbi:MAG: DNA repair protein RecO, partial [Flavobacterium sp.]
MLVKTKAIVISSLRYQEKGLIVKCFTESDGLKSYFIRDAFSAKKSNQKVAYFQPLSLLEIEASHKNKGTLEYFKEVKLAHPYHSINTDITKTTIAIFLSEMLHHSIKEEEKNQELYSFLETALLWLDSHDEAANFHLILLLEVTKYLGFYPDGSVNN